MIKLIVSDMDGTLFNSNQEISPANLAAINAANKQGVHFMIATGRNIDTIGPTLEKYGLKCGLILMNGAEVRDEELNIISTINIDKNNVLALAKKLGEMGYYPEYMTNKGSFLCGTKDMMEKNMGYRMLCLDRSHTMTLEQAIEIGKKSVFQQSTKRCNSIEEFLEQDIEIRKMIVFNPNIEFNEKKRKVLEKDFSNFSIVSSYPENIEINNINAKKGYGLLKAIDKLGIKKEEVAVFGDGYNDLSMFEEFPNAYAPVNAEYGIKKLAKEIIPSNNDDGVGKKINELLYLNKINI